MSKKRNRGLRKVCDCSRKQWSKCAHPWHFSFQWKGVHRRFSLDRLLDKTFESKGEAEAAADQLRSEIRSGTFHGAGEPQPAREAVSVRRLLELYGERVVTPRGEDAETAHTYASGVICRTPVPTVTGTPLPLGDWLIGDVTTDAIEQFRDIRQAAGKVGTNRNLAKLRAAFAWGASKKRSMVDESPFRDGDKPAVRGFEERARTRRLKTGEGERLLAQCGDHLRGLVECALETGMRRGEILTLQWSQVRWTPKPALFLPAWKTKTKRDRTIPMSSRLKAVLEFRRLDPAGEEHRADAYVFGTATGERITDFKRAWQAAVLRAHGHIPAYSKTKNLTPELRTAFKAINLHFHDLRREAGSRWLDGGVPLHQIQAWLGHTNISQTSTYLAVRDDGGDQVMASLEAGRTENLQERCKDEHESLVGMPRFELGTP